jgi:hypothetical protein
MDRVATSDRNFYDRCYFNMHDQSGEIFLVTGLGVYPNLGVTDAYAAARCGDRQWSVRFSDALGCRGLEQQVGGYRIEVVEPLRELILRCQSPAGDLDFDLRWTAAFPAVQEEPHLLLAGNRPIVDASRFCQMGNWSGQLRVGDREFAVSPGQWAGARDRSWGIRPIGEPDPPGRHPEAARLHLADRAGNPLIVEVETVTSVPLHVGAGYNGDPDWSHGRWMGREWSTSTVYDLTDPAVAGRIPFGVIDHLVRARLGDEEGWGLFEHASMGRHDPTGFADWSSVAP